ncbi:hypothetical protein EOA88_15015 [Mesorhizobium sp. M5C.F.Ca.IN.020.14.1.1]|nr:hypothetical protein EOA88_15015 [Mesorhizobium sp. M5C.F.Ca.IN.020.14.1.1]
MSFDPSEIDAIAAAVTGKLRRAGLLSGGSGGNDPGWGTNAVASAIAARLAQGLTPHHAPRGRTVSEGMMRLASAVSYKLGKAEDPKVVTFNKVASEVAKALYQAKKAVAAGGDVAGGREPVGVHSAVGVNQGGASD